MISKKTWSKRIVCRQKYNTPQMWELLQNIEVSIQKPIKVLKDDRTSTVVLIKYLDQQLLVKHSKPKNLANKIRRSFTRSRASKNFENVYRLKKHKIRTFSPIAMVENRYGPLRGSSFLLTSFLSGIDALHYFARNAMPNPQWPGIAKKIINTISNMADAGICHHDLNLSNIILVKSHPYLIDLDGMRYFPGKILREYIYKQERKRFMENWLEPPGYAPVAAGLFQHLFES